VCYKDQVFENEGGKQMTMRGLVVIRLQVLLFLFVSVFLLLNYITAYVC
jgi:hypothetical protein